MLELSQTLGISIPELARRSGYRRPQAFYDVINGKTRHITPKMADRITLAFPDVDRNAILLGEGELLVRRGERHARTNNHRTDEPWRIPLVPISAQGRPLGEFTRTGMNTDCEKVLSPIPGADFAITVAGESMAPEYPCGSHVLVKKTNAQAFIEWGKAYVLDTCNGTVIKKLAPSAREGCVRCVPVNPSNEFTPFDIPVENIYGFYRVLLCMSMK